MMQDNLYNLAFERTFLCSIIYEPQLFEDHTPQIKITDFYLPAHQAIFDSMSILTSKNMPIDEEFIKKELIKAKKFDEQVMLEILTANSAANVGAYCEEIKEKSKQRELLKITTTIKRCVIEEMKSSDETISDIYIQLKLIEEDNNNSIKIRTQRAAAIEAAAMPIMPKYETGIDIVDNHFDGGLELAQLIMIGGEKGSGKTAFSLQYLFNVSKGFKSAYLSYEMPWYKIQKRFAKHNPNDKQLDNFQIIDQGRDISEVEKIIRKLAREGTRFFTIDSLMKITNKYCKEKRNEQISDITARLSRLCIELNIIIVLIVQVSKEDLRSGYMAVKGSGDADHDADVMFFIKKDKNNEKKRNFICEKNRQNGNEFKEEVYINPRTIMLQKQAPSLYEVTYTSISDSEKISMPEIS